MPRQGYDLQFTRYDKGWRATFSDWDGKHSPTSVTGTGWERTPWRATQRAAWGALRRADNFDDTRILFHVRSQDPYAVRVSLLAAPRP